MLPLIVNVLGTLTVGLCAVLLLRAYHTVRKRLLLWCGVCFTGLTISNVLLIIDKAVVPDVSLYRWRLAAAAAAVLVMLCSLILESDES